MKTGGTLDEALYGKLPAVQGDPVLLTEDQTKTAADYLSKNWSKVAG